MEWVEILKQAVNPTSIITYGGLPLLTLVVFAETGLLVGFFLPGDSLLFTAGLLWANKALALPPFYFMLLCVTLAAVIGDNVGYYIGKKYGPGIFRQKTSLFFKPEYVTMTRNFFKKHGAKALVLGRFLPIIRTFAPVLAGVVALEYRKFLMYNVVGGVLWVLSLSVMGYLCGVQFPWIKDYYEHIVIGFIIATTIPIIRMIIKERREKKENPDADVHNFHDAEFEKSLHDAVHVARQLNEKEEKKAEKEKSVA